MENKLLEKDLDEAIKLMINGKNWSGIFTKTFDMYDCVYPFNNENIDEYYDKFNYEKGVLTVASSGDHMLHALLAGSDNITLFDINKLTYYFCMLKLAAVKALSYNEFFLFFGDEYGCVPRFYMKDIYEKINKYLDSDNKYFWNQLYEYGLSNSYLAKNLFNLVSSPSHNAYYEPLQYEKLKANSKNFEMPRFICADVLELPKYLKPSDQYSAIFLSNIRSYIKQEDYQKFVSLICNELSNVLIDDGLIAYGDSRIFECFGPRISGVYTHKKRKC